MQDLESILFIVFLDVVLFTDDKWLLQTMKYINENQKKKNGYIKINWNCTYIKTIFWTLEDKLYQKNGNNNRTTGGGAFKQCSK